MRLGQACASEPVEFSRDCSHVQGWGLTPVAGPELATGRALVRLLKRAAQNQQLTHIHGHSVWFPEGFVHTGVRLEDERIWTPSLTREGLDSFLQLLACGEKLGPEKAG